MIFSEAMYVREIEAPPVISTLHLRLNSFLTTEVQHNTKRRHNKNKEMNK